MAIETFIDACINTYYEGDCAIRGWYYMLIRQKAGHIILMIKGSLPLSVPTLCVHQSL
jgi:hypothetical protein